jgi:hypothetical protein
MLVFADPGSKAHLRTAWVCLAFWSRKNLRLMRRRPLIEGADTYSILAESLSRLPRKALSSPVDMKRMPMDWSGIPFCHRPDVENAREFAADLLRGCLGGFEVGELMILAYWWWRERDSTPRTFRSTVFKTVALNHSAIPPRRNPA